VADTKPSGLRINVKPWQSTTILNVSEAQAAEWADDLASNLAHKHNYFRGGTQRDPRGPGEAGVFADLMTMIGLQCRIPGSTASKRNDGIAVKYARNAKVLMGCPDGKGFTPSVPLFNSRFDLVNADSKDFDIDTVDAWCKQAGNEKYAYAAATAAGDGRAAAKTTATIYAKDYLSWAKYILELSRYEKANPDDPAMSSEPLCEDLDELAEMATAAPSAPSAAEDFADAAFE
tara:strand:- start:284 stop:979 length:696 start_codon:yes stop_codon:yes gene_type:complete